MPSAFGFSYSVHIVEREIAHLGGAADMPDGTGNRFAGRIARHDRAHPGAAIGGDGREAFDMGQVGLHLPIHQLERDAGEENAASSVSVLEADRAELSGLKHCNEERNTP